MVGPTADLLEDKEDLTTTNDGLKRIFDKARELIPKVNERMIISSFAGSRAVDISEDYVINCNNNFINVAGMQSPALTSSPAIGKYIFNTYIRNIF